MEKKQYQGELRVVNIRLVKEPSLYSEEPIVDPKSAVKLIQKELLGQLDREVVCVLNLKKNCQVINMNIVSMGSLDSSIVCAREVFKSSILSNSAGIIMIHNHTSGDVKPSKEDINVTEKIFEAGQVLGIPLLDHIIVGALNDKYFSFCEEGMLQGPVKKVKGRER